VSARTDPAAPLRADAARNRARVVEAGRRIAASGRPLQLNEVARLAAVGVGTVYRHFPTPQALLETLVGERLEELLDHAVAAADAADPWQGLADFLREAVATQVAEPGFAAVFSAAEDAQVRTSELKAALDDASDRLLARARDARAVREDITPDDVHRLLCGVAYAARIPGGEDEAASAARYTDILLAGLHTTG
jgi:AcrR family transcriptional regulator